MTLEVFHFDISGKEVKDSQKENRLFILWTLEVFQLDISGKDEIDLQSVNIWDILVMLLIPFNVKVNGSFLL